MVRVIIRRHCRPGREADLEKALLGLRANAMRQKGYISGETLRSADDPAVWLVVSTWTSAEQWKSWEGSSERQKMEAKIAGLLSEPQQVSIFSFVRRGASESAHTVDMESLRLTR
ncbi:MAG: antibiotic biosynthesis monooxygenase [Chloroflexi bacterium]|nr:antibiotic biosynthesis monooxygenase [Chloroflexota bacterium]